ncbi:pyridoxamine 5'-phosphate oxidase family protein [Tabrizicola sp.]|uniref:pyridoxamine 5'-phosphate oxidase family protein n=1 Tax=Tabrizicola sp. TaxID=2005166 RepID=UPI00286B0414|nr:pyridoxamine 5'-phosphate oxidase family protein [Tabrizicola sp.]
MLIRTLGKLECTKVLAENRLGHLACAREGRPYVVPIYFGYEGNCLYAFSMPGKKIEWMRASPVVSVLVEERGRGREWKSVIVDGNYEELPDRFQRNRAWALLSKYYDWWEPGAFKPVTPLMADHSDHVFFRILIDQLSGREAKETDLLP